MGKGRKGYPKKHGKERKDFGFQSWTEATKVAERHHWRILGPILLKGRRVRTVILDAGVVFIYRRH